MQIFEPIIERLRRFEPIQYIFGHTLWCGLDLKVTPSTLIPRPETADLVEMLSAVSRQFSDSSLSVLDIGTGSGCIAIALKKRHPEWAVTGIDISAEAIKIARENAKRNGIDAEFRKMDVFSDSIEQIEKFDIIVSNPPYIRESEKQCMRRNVLDFEPSQALFVPDDDPLLFYRRIAALHKAPYLFFEINESLGNETVGMLRKQSYTDIQIHTDSYGKSRFVSCRMAL